MEGNVDILGIVIILVLLAAAFWVKKKFFKSEMPKKVETFPGREATSVKKSDAVTSEAIASENKALDKNEAEREPVQQPSVNNQQKDIESLQGTEIPPVKIVTEHGAFDTCEKIKAQIPEDSVLRRHFLTQLMTEIESEVFPRPTDSILKRHYDSLILAKFADRLVEMTEHTH
jgi:FtsZ-interacting cell division protein ZipA